MASYYNYRFRAHGLMAIAKKHGNPLTLLDTFRLIADTDTTDNEMEMYCMVEECVALTETPRFMFIDTLTVAKAIQKSSFQADKLALDNGIRFISFPKGLQVCGLPASGVMVSIGDYEERHLWHNAFFRAIKYPTPPYSFVQSDVTGYLSFTYPSPHEDGKHCKLNIPFESVAQFINAETTEDMVMAIRGQILGVELNNDEMLYQMNLAQLALKTLVYAQAMPEKVRRGVPDKRAGNNKTSILGEIVSAPDTIKTTGSAPSSVGFHFRQLRHEKYYKGDHKDKTVGSRWVFIPPYERGMEAETLTT